MAASAQDAVDLVFGEYTQAELDRQYDQRAWDPNAAASIARYASASEDARRALGTPRSFAYGPGAAEWLDVFPAAPGAPVHVFVHGGAWRSLGRRDSSFPAPLFHRAGAHFVALDFSLLPAATLTGMVDEVRRAIAWLHRNAAASFGGDPGRIHVSGHSSGAHMAACLLVTDWAALGLPPDVLKSGLLVSGMFDLAPVRLSARNEYVRLTADTEDALSPQRHLSRLRCPVSVACGSGESAEFARQSRHLAEALEQAGHAAGFHVAPGASHFEVAFGLADAGHWLGREALRLMGLPIGGPAG